MKPDYNDGKWHVWNGGQCPVHPKTVVEFVDLAGGEARHCVWGDGDTRIVAFRVVKEYRGPREFWLVNGRCYESPINADCAAFGQAEEIIHVREVLE